MKTWCIQDTRNLVFENFGPTQLELARPCLQSVVERKNYVHYHHSELRSLLRDFLQAHLEDKSMIDILADDDAGQTFNSFMTKAGAHIIGCVQSLHALGDILGHATYFSLGLNLNSKPLAERDISLAKVIQRCNEPKLSEVKRLLSDFKTGGTMARISALANHSKHRSVVRPLLSEHFTVEPLQKHELLVAAFKYDGVEYPEIPVSTLLEPEYARCSKAVVDIGNALNVVLRSTAAHNATQS